MSHTLVTVTPTPGHVNPMLAIACCLRDDGPPANGNELAKAGYLNINTQLDAQPSRQAHPIASCTNGRPASLELIPVRM